MMKAMNSRAKRATDDLFELGDRLTDKLSKKLKNGKLSSETHPAYLRNSTSLTKTKTSISAEWSNLLNVENGENSQTNGLKNNTSRTAAPALPSPIPSQKLFSKNALGEKWGRIMMFFQCEKDTKYKTCMNHDMKLKLEKSFGSLESLEEATGLPEYQLLPMTMKLLNEQMDMFM